MTNEPRIYNGDRILSSINMLAKLDGHKQKNETVYHLRPSTKIN